MLHQGSVGLYKWLNFADEASKRQPGLTRIEKLKDVTVDFESNPKMQTLINMLTGLQTKTTKSNKKAKESPRNGINSPTHMNGTEESSKLMDFSTFQAETGIKKK